MTTSVVCLAPEMDVTTAMQLFVEHQISGAPVLDERGQLVGILTERDCLRTVVAAGYHGNHSSGCVREYMSPNVVAIAAEMSLLEVAERFTTEKYRRYPVLLEHRLVGIISRRDVIRAVLRFG
jgi:CBS domain-containing protein